MNAVASTVIRFAVTFGQTGSWGFWYEDSQLIIKFGPIAVLSVERIYLVD